MHIGWLGGHFDEEYTPWEYLRRSAKASFSVIRLPSRRKTASISATSRNLRPRTRSEPCSTTAARSASRCSAAQRAASSLASTRSSGGFSGRTSTSSSEYGDENNISSSLSVAGDQDEGNRSGAALSRCTDLSSTSVARSARIG